MDNTQQRNRLGQTYFPVQGLSPVPSERQQLIGGYRPGGDSIISRLQKVTAGDDINNRLRQAVQLYKKQNG